jgi:hemerythrin HHE cation binding domain-containing protein
MRRSAALTPLSHDHQHALAVAVWLRRADDAGTGPALERFSGFFDTEGRAHFRIEEDVLLGAIGPDDAEWAAAVARVREDHEAIRAAADELPRGPAGARALGRRLHDHVRFEEQVLFGLLERRLSEDALERLGRDVTEAERASRRFHSPLPRSGGIIGSDHGGEGEPTDVVHRDPS